MGLNHADREAGERNQRAVAAHLATFPGLEFSSHDLARVLGISNTSVRTALRRLAEAGQVVVTRVADPALGHRMATRYRAAPAATTPTTTETTGARS